jgi:hypothetical protein
MQAFPAARSRVLIFLGFRKESKTFATNERPTHAIIAFLKDVSLSYLKISLIILSPNLISSAWS